MNSPINSTDQYFQTAATSLFKKKMNLNSLTEGRLDLFYFFNEIC